MGQERSRMPPDRPLINNANNQQNIANEADLNPHAAKQMQSHAMKDDSFKKNLPPSAAAGEHEKERSRSGNGGVKETSQRGGSRGYGGRDRGNYEQEIQHNANQTASNNKPTNTVNMQPCHGSDHNRSQHVSSQLGLQTGGNVSPSAVTGSAGVRSAGQ